ncbi:MAG: hypothetical protein ACRDGN_05165 [bacterium]
MRTPGAIAPLILGLPAVAWMYTSAALSLLRLVRDELPTGSRFIVEEGNSSCAEKRNTIVRGFLQNASSEYEHLLLLDSDMICPPGMVGKLLAAQKDVVGVMYTIRFPPFHTVGGRTLRPDGTDPAPSHRCYPIAPGQGLQRVDRVGGGVMLIRRAVLTRIAPPWFAGMPENTDADDFFFCQKVIDAGFELWIDTDLEAAHLTIAPVTPGRAGAWRDAWEPAWL